MERERGTSGKGSGKLQVPNVLGGKDGRCTLSLPLTPDPHPELLLLRLPNDEPL